MRSMIVPRTTRRSPFPALRDVRAFDGLFDDLWRGLDPTPAPARALAFAPKLDVKETDEEYVVSVELPGVEEKDFDVSLEDQVLTIRGEKKSEHTEEKAGYRHVETVAGSFERRLALPAEVDADAVKARFKNGVLRVTVPKTPQVQPRTIPVTTA